MQKLYIESTELSPEINFSPDENQFYIRGISSPEDTRALYYPVIDWIKGFINEISGGKSIKFSAENPVKFQVDLSYFNSSTAKFLYDIFSELKKLSDLEVPLIVEWCYDPEDSDQLEAGEDISILTDMKFTYVPVESDLE